jgi:hypothetical protein
MPGKVIVGLHCWIMASVGSWSMSRRRSVIGHRWLSALTTRLVRRSRGRGHTTRRMSTPISKCASANGELGSSNGVEEGA